MESDTALLGSNDNEIEVDTFCKASRFTLALGSTLGLSCSCSGEKIKSASDELMETQNIIDMLKSIESKKKTLLEIRHKIKQYQFSLEVKDVIDAEVHLKRCQSFEEIIGHMSLIIKESEQLRNRLQSPLMSDALNIHSSQQRYMLELFSIINSDFKEFEFHLDILNKSSKLDFKTIGNEHDAILLEAKKQIAELQRAVYHLKSFRSSLSKLCSLKAGKPLEPNVIETS